MSQMFTPGTNTLARLSLFIGLLFVVIIVGAILIWDNSPLGNARAGIAVAQPVRFSHELHSGALNINCNYCHWTAEESSYGGIPDTHVCMSCHSQIAIYSELLEPVRTSYATGERIPWQKVHDLAEHVYFNHSVHISKGFACETCHGPVTQMPLIWQAETMTMNWCLDCHQAPEQYVRPLDEVYTFGYEPPIDQAELGPILVEANNINAEGLSNCSVCHR